MKELFNSLSNTSDFFNEKRKVFEGKGPERPEPQIDISERIDKKGNFEFTLTARQAKEKAASKVKGVQKAASKAFEKKGTKLKKAAKKVAEAEKGVDKKLKNKILSRIDRLRNNVQFTKIMDHILEKGAKYLNSGDPNKINTVVNLVDRVQLEYKHWKKDRSTFPAAMYKIVDRYLS